MNHLIHLKHQDRIGWIGLGEMGYYMASNLQRYLASLHLNMIVWNRDPAKSAKLRHHGVHIAKSIEDLVAQSNIIFTSLANDAAVQEVYTQLIDLANQVEHPIIFVETSTIYPALATELQKQLAACPQKHTYLQCPVFGRPPVAKAAKLIWVTSGGDEKIIKKMCLYFTTMSKSIIHLNTKDVAKACNFKLIGNFFVVGTMELLAEGLTLAEKAEVDPQSILKFIEAFFPAPAWIEYSRKMVDGTAVVHKEDGFSVDLGLKDVGHMRQLALETGASLPTADLAYNHLKAVHDQGLGDMDWSSLINSLRSASKLPSMEETQLTKGEKQ
ncbi:hypothetical protein BX616_000913 [Lobosporangium transversale]|uniref:NAD binding domain of 6-phosphogluconate dehydrogenase-domain-containing protein n=1 Tax=Lobosporangium transversale TaxID=64571 RepID=A0A1Y2GS39_9FUNG|nr:NAD binding domain of 6-phosphogluconate dehydrogenase-domain-containing protein [Lobosporangium transversale]KAF9917459.1 hypothetical protein BX616_000913 [Lobosporangium transversale]ORZ20958.1 NAD binding domain of 6-phosphogluconate dehydrogenase-domain-containing protein [Lobosporangium transversale]|eukprot:XP_021882867.1 NAD binding domain of 6-phosphogluconate dehydrogenase-domain-containing protein [Lobosporangium transversale]